MENQDISINEMLVTIAKQEIDNVNRMQELVSKGLSYCYCALKLMCELYQETYEKADRYEKEFFEEVGYADILQERNFIDCLFQLEKNFKLNDVDVELLKHSVGVYDGKIDPQAFINIFDYFSELYPEVMQKIDDHISLSITNNEQFYETLKSAQAISNKDGKNIEFKLTNLSEDQIEVLNEYTKVHEYIAKFMENSEEANSFVTEAIEDFEMV